MNEGMWERLTALTPLDWVVLGAFFGISNALLDRLAGKLMAKQVVREAEEALNG